MGVYRRKDTGVWEFRKTIKGVKYYESFPAAKTPLDAEIAAAKVLRDIYEGKYGRDGQEIGAVDFVQFCKDVYLPDIKDRLKVPKNTEYKVNTLMRHFKGKQLKDITLLEVQKYRSKRLKGVSRRGKLRQASSVKDELSTLSGVLEMAIDAELLARNPVRKLKWGRGQTESKRERILEPDEEARLLAQLDRFYEPKCATLISLNTGLRRMGILKLKTSDIDPARRVAMYTAKGGKKKPMPLNSDAWAIIAELLKTATPDGYLFHNRTGHNISAGQGAFKLAARRAGMPELVFHDLRHTFASRVRDYTDAFTTSHLLGHNQTATTDLYVAEEIEKMRLAVEALGAKRVLPFSRIFHGQERTG
jgi:integrase